MCRRDDFILGDFRIVLCKCLLSFRGVIAVPHQVGIGLRIKSASACAKAYVLASSRCPVCYCMWKFYLNAGIDANCALLWLPGLPGCSCCLRGLGRVACQALTTHAAWVACAAAQLPRLPRLPGLAGLIDRLGCMKYPSNLQCYAPTEENVSKRLAVWSLSCLVFPKQSSGDDYNN